MKKIIIVIALLALAALVYWWLLPQEQSLPASAPSANMKITSSAFQHNQSIPLKYTCDGEDINPPLEVSELPVGAQSLVLIIDDPDVPSGTFTHWVVFNIDPNTSSIAENSVPTGALEGKNSFGGSSYGGPCPPSGVHNYHFKIYALDSKLELATGVDINELLEMMTDHVLDWTELIGLYQR